MHADDVRNDVRRIDLGEERRDDSVEAGLCLNNEMISWRLPNFVVKLDPYLKYLDVMSIDDNSLSIIDGTKLVIPGDMRSSWIWINETR